MADQLFPVFELPEIPDNPEYDEKYSPSVYFDFETGDFLRDGAGRMIASTGREAYIQWCLKMASTERESYLAYSDDIGVELEDLEELPGKDERESEIERTITEALLVHPATEYVRNFIFEHEGDAVRVTFDVKGYPWEEIDTLTITT